MTAVAASEAIRHKACQEPHASRAPICLNLKEIRQAAQVAGRRRFDLRETLKYLKVKRIGQGPTGTGSPGRQMAS
jgi:hypothetical protein